MADSTLSKTPPPPAGEKTPAQSGGGAGGARGLLGLPGLAGIPVAFAGGDPSVTSSLRRLLSGRSSGVGLPGIPDAPAGTYDVYREILTDPTVQIGRAVVFGPILASEWSYEPRDRSVPREVVAFVRDLYDPIAVSLKTQMLRGLDFGSRSFEQVYGVVDRGGRSLITVRKFKPLRPEHTRVLVDDETGAYAGLANGDVELLPEETLHFAYDMEDDDFYGRSRLENVRERAWWPHVCLERRLGQLAQKVSQIIPVVKGPLGARETDADGNVISGYDAGQAVLNALVYGDGVLVENLAAALDDVIGNADLAKLSKWDIDSFDTGQSATGIGGIIEGLRYYDQLKMRGMLRPERTATEGQHGTKAEVAEQADVGLAEGELLHKSIVQLVNWHSVNRLLVWNFGPQFEDAVRIVPTPLIDEKRAVFRWLFQTLLANPAVLDLIVARLNLDAIADNLGVPTMGPLNVEEDDVGGGAGDRVPTLVDPGEEDVDVEAE